jgi:hypothetical protein
MAKSLFEGGDMGEKWLGLEAGHSPQTSTEVKKMRIYVSADKIFSLEQH